MIVIVDYGMGNVGSILNMLRKVGAEAAISSDISEIEKAEKLILPGVGAFNKGMENLNALNLLAILNDKVLNNKTPVLGICLGMQLLTRKSEEGTAEGIGWIDADTVRFKFDAGRENMKIPHMGWNYIHVKRDHFLFRNIREKQRFYFVHSYHVVCENEEDILATAYYGHEFVSAIGRGNIVGVQFHPEKSHTFGMKVLKNFAGL